MKMHTLPCFSLLTLFALGLPFVVLPEVMVAQGSVIASDNFNRANETPFAVGGNWQHTVAGPVVFHGTSNLTNNKVASAANEGIYYWQGAGTFDNTKQFARATVDLGNGEAGLVLLGGSDHAVMVGWGPPNGGGTVYIYWYNGVGETGGQLLTAPSTLQPGDVIEAALEDGTIYAKVNGAIVASVANTTNLSGKPGFVTYQPGATLDNWVAGTPVSYTISGTITEGGLGIDSVLVTASGGFNGSATTNSSGVYALTGIPSGTVAIQLTPTFIGHTMNPLTRTVVGPLTGNVSGEDFTSTFNTNNILTINAIHGSVTRNPDQPTYDFGTEVTLTAVADGGYYFLRWSGDVPAGHQTDNPLQVTMIQHRTITATFDNGVIIASDNFNRADESPLAVGGNWEQPVDNGDVDLTNNQIVSTPSEALYYWNGAGSFDNSRQFARVRVVQTDGEIGLVLLGADDQALIVSWSGGAVYIYWYSGGSYQGSLATASSALQSGDLIEAVLDADTIYAKVNGSIVASVENSTTLTSGTPGFETYQNGAILDDWQAGTPGVYDPLPIQLASFSGTALANGGVFLSWLTVSEQNNYGFEIQRSTTVQQLYQTIPGSFIPGHGTTNEPQQYSYTVSIVTPGVWYFRLKQIDLDGTIHYSDGIRVDVLTGVAEKENPTVFSLSQNYPNPWNPSTTIRYGVPQASFVTLTVFNTLGQQVAQLVNEQRQAGYHDVTLLGDALASGVYLYRIQADDYIASRKFLLLK